MTWVTFSNRLTQSCNNWYNGSGWSQIYTLTADYSLTTLTILIWQDATGWLQQSEIDCRWDRAKFSKSFEFYPLLCWLLEAYLASPSHSRLWNKSSLKRLSYKPLLFPIHTPPTHGWGGTHGQNSALVLTSFLSQSDAFPESSLNYIRDEKQATYSKSFFRAVLPPSWAVGHHWNTCSQVFYSGTDFQEHFYA